MRKLIGEKVDWWESWLMRKSIDEKGELGFEDGQIDGYTHACMHVQTDRQC